MCATYLVGVYTYLVTETRLQQQVQKNGKIHTGGLKIPKVHLKINEVVKSGVKCTSYRTIQIRNHQVKCRYCFHCLKNTRASIANQV